VAIKQYLKRYLPVFVLCLVCLSGAQAETVKPFVFTAIPDQDESLLRTRFDKVAEYLSEQLNVEVEYIPVKSYASAVTAFRNNQVQLAWFGGLSGVRARLLVDSSEAIVQGYEDQFFKTYFIANASLGLLPSEEFPEAIKNTRFIFGSKSSTSGRLMPEYYIREHFKQSPDEVFQQVGFSGNHSRTIELVQSGAYQVGALNYKVWQRAVEQGKVDPQKVVMIWQTPDYPDYQWSIRGDVDQVWGEGFKDKVTAALLGMQEKKLLASFPRRKFVAASNEDYAGIEQTARQIGLLD